MSTENNIRLLEAEIIKAHKAGEFQVAQQLGQALKNARGQAQPPTQEPIPVEQPASGGLGSFGLGMQRQGGRFLSGGQDLAQLAMRAAQGAIGQEVEGQTDIAAREREAETDFASRTREHPLAAAAGEATAFAPFAAGRTPLSAFGRGAFGGALSFNEDPSQRATQAAVGGAANTAGFGLLNKLNPGGVGGRAQSLGMRTLPEQRGPVLFRNAAQDLRAFSNASARTRASNIGLVTKEVLKSLGDDGAQFTHATLGDATSRANTLFTKAVGSREKVYFGDLFDKKIFGLIAKEENKLIQTPKAMKLLTGLQEKMQARGGILSTKDYQSFRSDISNAIIDTKKSRVKKVLGDILNTVDDQAQLSLAGSDPTALKNFREARKLWRQIQLVKPEGVIDFNSGQVSPRKFRSVLMSQDESGYLLNRNTGRLNELLRLDELTPRGTASVGTIVPSRTGGIPLSGNIITKPIESSLLGMSRLPTRAIEGAPLGLTVPRVKSILGPSEEVNLNTDTLE